MNIVAQFTDKTPFLRFKSSKTDLQSTVNGLVRNAAARIDAGDYGGAIWYSAHLPTANFRMASPVSIGPLLQQLSGQTRITGWRRLGTDVLLEFVEELPPGWNESTELLAPKTVTQLHIAAHAPCDGLFSFRVAHAVAEAVAAICTFALGRATILPPAVFPTRSEHLATVRARHTDLSIPALARKNVSLNIFGALGVPGGLDYFSRLRAALLTFDAAVQQQRDAVACILYVVAAECLTTPRTKWRNEKLTTRFIEFFEELMPDVLDQIVGHGNFESVLGIRRGIRTADSLRRKLLTRIYEFRSGRLHDGLRPTYSSVSMPFEPSDGLRRSLFADFAEGAILGYVMSPRSSIIGHPDFPSA